MSQPAHAEVVDSVVAMRAELDTLRAENKSLRKRGVELEAANSALKSRVTWLEAQLRALCRARDYAETVLTA